MGPITLIDKSTIQGLSGGEVDQLERFYSLVVSPILMREILSMLAKEPKKGRNWEAILRSLAKKVNTYNSYIPAEASQMARQSLLGNQTPMDGRVPLAGGKRIRSRDGTYGVFFDEPKEKATLRDWAKGDFNKYYRATAQQIRALDQGIDLTEYQKTITDQLSHFPKFDNLLDLATWLDQTYYHSANPEYHLRMMANNLLSPEETNELIKRFGSGASSYQDAFPYAFYYYRVNTLFLIGLSQNLVSASKSAKAHLDFQYLYYLPFSMAFTTSDNLLFEVAKLFKRSDQILINGRDLKKDLSQIHAFFDGLTDEKRRSYRNENASWPPEAVSGPTQDAWKSFMRPKSELVAGTPKFSKHEHKHMAQDLIKRMDEAVVVDSKRQESLRGDKREKSTLYARSLKFVNGALEIAGTLNSDDWNEVKNAFDKTHVKKIYNLHADIWHPSDPYKELADDLCNEKMSRFLYLGDIEPFDVVEQIWRWSPYLDQILIPDPFHSPWARREEYNPVAKPEQYELDTLKLVYFLVLIGPLIANGQVLLVPNPTEFNPDVKSKILKLLMAQGKSPDAMKLIRGDEDRVKKVGMFSILRTLARLPEDKRSSAIKSEFGEEMQADILKLTTFMRKRDPLCIDRDDFSGELVVARSGAGFEEALLLSALYQATPLLSLECRKNQFSRLSEVDEKLKVFNRNLREIKIAEVFDPFFNAFAREKNAAGNFRDLIGNLPKSITMSEKELIDRLKDHEEECEFLTLVFGKKGNQDPSIFLKDCSLKVLGSSTGFLTESAEKIISIYDEQLLKSLPRYAIEVPASKVPDNFMS